MGNFQLARPTLQPVDIPSPIDQYQKVMGMKNVMQRAKIGGVQLQREQLGLQQEQQQQKDEQIVNTLLAWTHGSLPEALKLMPGRVSPQTLAIYQKHDQDTQKALADLDDKKLAVSKDKNDRLGQLVVYGMKLSPEDYVKQWPQLAGKANELMPGLKLDPAKPVPQDQLQGVSIGVLTGDFALKEEQAKRQNQIVVPPGGQVVDLGTGKATTYGVKPPPTPTDEDKAISDYMAAHNLQDTPGTRHFARLKVKAELAAAGRPPEKPEKPGDQGTIETTAGDYLAEANGDANKALAQLEKDVQAKNANPMLRRYASRIRFRIRERVRPGVPGGHRDRLAEILGETK